MPVGVLGAMKLYPHQEMSMLFQSSRLAVGALLIGLGLGAGQARAADADQIAKALVAAFEANGKAQASSMATRSPSRNSR
jgi:hypothetical protein